MARAFILVLDSFGIGGAPDAARFGDAGADTLGHIAAECLRGGGNRASLREGPLALPNLSRLGLALASELASGQRPETGSQKLAAEAFWGAASEVSNGKDTPSGHWEIAGVPVTFDWGYFPETVPTFPDALTSQAIRLGNLPGILGDCHASGTEIIARLGEEHLKTGKPIFYTSADSVIQIAAHEESFGLERLYDLCEIVRKLADPLNVGRVIARPFVGKTAADFERTGNRRDYAVPPPEPTLLDRLTAQGRQVIGIGKIGDIFAHRGLSRTVKANGNMALFDATIAAMRSLPNGGFLFANFVDFDSLYGHRRDVPGYAAALEAFDRRLPEALALLEKGDLLMLTADHGCDPTWRGTDHTRERVLVLGLAPGRRGGSVGIRDTYADMGETVAAHLGIPPGRHGTNFLGPLNA